MRVNIYAEEMTERVQVISKEIEGQTFTGLRLYLELPASYYTGGLGVVPATGKETHSEPLQLQAPFIHHLGDDDSAAVTFWGKRDLRDVLKVMLAKLDAHYAKDSGHQFSENKFS